MTQQIIHSTCPYCGVGCGVTIQQQGIKGDTDHPANQGALCVKGSALKESLQMPSRLLYPRLNGVEINWSDAIETVREKITDAIKHYGPDSVAMYVSGQLLTEDYYVANKFMKGFVGSANIDTNSRLCMSSAVAAHCKAFGEDVVPVSYDDLDKADLIVITGANTAWTHPVIFRRIQQAREQNPNLKLVVIDPRRTVTAEQADLHIPIGNDDDVALFNGLLRYCCDHQAVDEAFIAEHTEGFEALLAEVEKAHYQLDVLSQQLGVSESILGTFFHWFASSHAAITLFCQGVNQSTSGVDKGNAIINLHLATGQINRCGSGPFSITGQPNAMGGREVGGLANQLAVHRGFTSEDISAVAQFWQAPNVATQPGLKAVDLFSAAERGEIKVLWIMATNPAVSMPDNQQVRRALEKCDFVIVSDITADTDTARYADLLLPASGWGEKHGMVTNSERRLSRQRQFLPAPGETRPDWWQIARVGSALCDYLGVADAFDYSTPAQIFREFAAMTGLNSGTPLKLDLSQFAHLSDEAYDNWLPWQWGGNKPFGDHHFSTDTGKARFAVTVPCVRRSDLWLNTGRQRDQWHTMTRTGHIAQLSASEVQPTLYLNALTAESYAIKSGQLVELEQGDTSILAIAELDNALSDQQLFMSMHWAGRYGGQSQINAVVQACTDQQSGQPAFKSSSVSLSQVKAKTYGMYLGSRADFSLCTYASLQQERNGQIWRFVDREERNIEDFQRQLTQRRLVLELETGWLGIDCTIHGEHPEVAAILMLSGKPIKTDYQALLSLLGMPLDIGRLLSICMATQQAKLICSCYRVTDWQIKRALESKECVDLKQLQTLLKCGTNCGSCLPELKQWVQTCQTSLVTNEEERHA
ncbi:MULTISPECIES: nitrate reductase [Vibrio]|uniref:Putative nitrate reductase n=1 Tax=Vibrio proteolyticus NBRC 13287 TaxID=1219065 RepID=U3A0L4_VIBPR|nr:MULTISPECIES: nitrate reductase [Vibrio]NAW56537.1 molybdopterin-dependent oxidoreductase [Vibrio sp. V36_P2S2PM302]NAX20444.1 molybdopterin-dependent oxidoreductase [Vibrio sp. V39_P1S14PM300]NAX25751.1 molybdopterin-dependent oxidoreductase [Vibrio sp. V38_P2S17PM301]NAX28771.1 molybdopterin-dependent oxidoreductase [Vibrio sp. V37_P2S8PM304]GAD67230.1 putative nitrate reductase [Vibrio proteolyticus NBRC 13287]